MTTTTRKKAATFTIYGAANLSRKLRNDVVAWARNKAEYIQYDRKDWPNHAPTVRLKYIVRGKVQVLVTLFDSTNWSAAGRRSVAGWLRGQINFVEDVETAKLLANRHSRSYYYDDKV